MKNDFIPMMKQLDRWIRTGKGHLTRKELKKINPSEIPRPVKVKIASLSWRADLPLLGIKILNPLVRPSAKKPKKATEEEKAEYSACLIKIGATEEGLKLLQSLNDDQYPQILLYKAFARISQWNYRKSIPDLRKYVQSPSISGYQSLVGKANLASALVYERRHSAAELVLKDLFQRSQQKDQSFVLGYTLELMAQHYILQKDWDQAEKSLLQAENLLRETESLVEFFVRKWRSILFFEKYKGEKGSLKKLGEIRKEAQKRHHWETIRLCDRYEAIVLKKQKLFLHLYFGTPFDSFRRWMLHDWQGQINIPSDYIWNLGGKSRNMMALDTVTGIREKSGTSLKPGQLLHRVLLVLASDFYRPFRLPSLHYHLYPDQFFNPISSSARVHNAILRTRTWLTESQLPLEIAEGEGNYQLKASGPCSLRITTFNNEKSDVQYLLEKIRLYRKKDSFSTSEASEILSCTTRSVRRLCSEAIQKGLLESYGRGPTTRYRFCQEKPLAKAS